MNTTLLFSSAKQDWETPRWLFHRLDAEFHFTLDAAASADNALCAQYYTEAEDALRQPWTGAVWVNPPYGRDVYRWVARGFWSAYGHTDDGFPNPARVVVMLVAARTDVQWWHQFAMEGTEIRFIRGRVKFSGNRQGAPFPSAVLVFDRFKVHPVAVSTLEPDEEETS